MPPPGTRLGAYEVLSPLGRGGMGEVYRARDTALGREVAVKTLPDAFAHDADRLARFEREARTLAALNHPNIAQVYGLERTPALTALVMELVEGPTLAERLADGPIPVDEALAVARQIAHALEAAHERGIVHRDLKPANVKVRPDGAVKVLDFGLAKALVPDHGRSGADAAPHVSLSPTITTPAMTQAGIVLGTAAYMAPEQARGRPVDQRADIWAFACVLYEMLTGQPAFGGDHEVSLTLSRVLQRDPDFDRLPPETPARVRTILTLCLRKDPRQRVQAAGDVALALEGAFDAPPDPRPPAPAVGRLWTAVPAAVAASLATAAAAWVWLAGGATPEAGWRHFTQVTDMVGEETLPTLSPDGSTVAYASRARGTWDIYAQRAGGRNAILVAGDPDRDESGPAFSPDGRSLAYHESDLDGGIFIVGATGESSRRLTDFGFHPAWSPDGARIAFSTEEIVDPYARFSRSALWVADLAGGPPRRLDEGDAAQPVWSPSGERIAFWTQVGGDRDLVTIPAGGGTRTPVTHDSALDWSPVWSPDGRYLYFASDRGGSMNLWRIAVDQASGEVTGPPEPVTTGVQAAADLPGFSADGSRLVFRSRVAAVNPVAVPYDPATHRAGTPVVLSHANSTLVPTDVSPDGRWLLLHNIGERQEDLFVSAADGSGLRRLTDDAARDRVPKFTPDGRAAVFYSNRDGDYGIWAVGVDGGALRKLMTTFADNPTVSPSGDRFSFSAALEGRRAAYVARMPAVGSVAEDTTLLPNAVIDGASLVPTDWSDDGRMLAGRLDANGRSAGVAVYDLAASAARKVSDDRSGHARWLPDSRHLLYVIDRGTTLVTVDTVTGRRTVIDGRLSPPADSVVVLAPDGRTIYYGGARAEADIWIAERRAPE